MADLDKEMFLEEIRMMIESGEAASRICNRIDMKAETIKTRLTRYGEPELKRRFDERLFRESTNGACITFKKPTRRP